MSTKFRPWWDCENGAQSETGFGRGSCPQPFGSRISVQLHASWNHVNVPWAGLRQLSLDMQDRSPHQEEAGFVSLLRVPPRLLLPTWC